MGQSSLLRVRQWPAVEFRILGPIEAEENGLKLDLGGLRERALLARFLLSANRVVHYVLVRTKADVDSQVRAWLTEAYASSPV